MEDIGPGSAEKLHHRVGKLNPSKLSNFLEIECFALVACAENSLIDPKCFLDCPLLQFQSLASCTGILQANNNPIRAWDRNGSR